MIGPDESTALLVDSPQGWRHWLEQNASTTDSVWLILQRKKSPNPGVRLMEAIEEGLCFGWVDSVLRSRDEHSSYLRFTPRRSASKWSPRNAALAERLIDEGRMAPRGQAEIDRAKTAGRWPVTR